MKFTIFIREANLIYHEVTHPDCFGSHRRWRLFSSCPDITSSATCACCAVTARPVKSRRPGARPQGAWTSSRSPSTISCQREKKSLTLIIVGAFRGIVFEGDQTCKWIIHRDVNYRWCSTRMENGNMIGFCHWWLFFLRNLIK